VAQLRIIEKLSQADTQAVYMIAEKLKKAVMENSTAHVAMYAPLLTNSANISILADTTIFDKKFYAKAMDMVASGPGYAGHNMAVLLRKLHDPTSLDYVFEHFSSSDNPRIRNLLISILDGFEHEQNPTVRAKVSTWLRDKQATEKSPVVERSIRENLKRFNKK
jgi:hypothetical protein